MVRYMSIYRNNSEIPCVPARVLDQSLRHKEAQPWANSNLLTPIEILRPSFYHHSDIYCICRLHSDSSYPPSTHTVDIYRCSGTNSSKSHECGAVLSARERDRIISTTRFESSRPRVLDFLLLAAVFIFYIILITCSAKLPFITRSRFREDQLLYIEWEVCNTFITD